MTSQSRQSSFASDTEAEMSDERRAEIEAVARAIQPFLSAVARGDNVAAVLGAAADDAVSALDRLRDARGDDEDDLRQWLLRAVGSASSVRSAKSVVERLVADALARSPQGEDHEVDHAQALAEDAAGIHTPGESEDER